MKRGLLKYTCIIFGLFFYLSNSVAANDKLSSEWQASFYSNARAHILQATEQEISLSIEINLAKNYKTYWQSAGSAGLPPIIQINGANILEKTVEIKYPQPQKYTTEFTETWGYEDRVILFVTVDRKDTQSDSSLNIIFDYAVCDEICLPVRAEFSLHLDAGNLRKTLNYIRFLPDFQQIPEDIKLKDSQILTTNKSDDMLTLTLASPIKGDIFITDIKGRFYQTYSTDKTHVKFKIFGNNNYSNYTVSIQYSDNGKNYQLIIPVN